MGVIDIRRRSETLSNRLSFHPYTTDIGARHAASANAAIGGALFDVSRTALVGMDKFGSTVGVKKSGRGGGGSGGGGEDGASSSNMNEAVADYQAQMTSFDHERMAETINEPEDWAAGNATTMRDAKDRVRREYKMTDEQFAAFNRRTMGYDQTMLSGWGRRARTVRQDKDVNTTGINLATATEAVSRPDATPTAWADWAEAMEAYIAAKERKQGRMFSPEERAALKRVGGEKVFQALTAELIAAATNDAVGRGADGGAAFDERIKIMEDKKADWMPESSKFKDPKSGREINLLRDALNGANTDKLRADAIKDMKAAKAEWRTAHDAAEAKRKKAAVDGVHQKIVDLYTGKNADGTPILPPLDENDPNSIVAHYGLLAKMEKAAGEALRNVAPADADMYVRSAARTAQHGANKASELELKRNDKEFLESYADPRRLGDALSGQPKMTPGQAMRAAVYAHGNNLISDEAYSKALKVCSEAVNSDNDDFIAAACDAIGYACPGLLSSKKGEIVINRAGLKQKDKIDPEAAKTGVKRIIEEDGGWAWFDKTEDVTLGHLRQALSLFTKQIYEDDKSGKYKTKADKLNAQAEYLKRFKELIKPHVEDYNKRKLQDALDEIDRSFGVPRPMGGNAIMDIRLPR